MEDPTSDLAEDVDPAEAPLCATCGEPILNSPTHRVITWIETASVESVHLCDDTCRNEWQSSRSPD